MARRRTGGYMVIVDPLEGTREFNTATCGHCQYLVHYATRAQLDERTGGCFVCGKLICLPCVEIGKCTPWEKQMEASEDRDRFRRSAGLE